MLKHEMFWVFFDVQGGAPVWRNLPGATLFLLFRYFKIYDTDNRQGLLQAYHDQVIDCKKYPVIMTWHVFQS